MPAQILDGKALATTIQDEIRVQVAEYILEDGVTPCLAAVLVGENAASEVYVRNKRLACERAGIESQLHRLPADVSQDDLLALIGRLNSPNVGRRDKIREATVTSWACSPAKAQRQLNWNVTTPLLDQMRQTVAWYRQQRWL